MARGQSCLLQVPGVCNHDPATTVACHSNRSEHGKGASRKADDCWTVHGCSACHEWLDRRLGTPEDTEAIFNTALLRMHTIWWEIVHDPHRQRDATPREVKAARWALESCKSALAERPG
jgi:hypothetical protein